MNSTKFEMEIYKGKKAENVDYVFSHFRIEKKNPKKTWVLKIKSKI